MFEGLSPEVRALAEKIETATGSKLELARFAKVLRRKGQRSDARSLALSLRAAYSGDNYLLHLTDWVIRDQVPVWHFNILHDAGRNQAYLNALRHWVQPDSTVLEIGTGSGLLAMMAAQAGAKRVYTIERSERLAETAREIVALNGLSHKITVIANDAYKVKVGAEIDEPADLFVAELVDDSPLGEGLLPLTRYARQHLLRPGAVCLPCSIEIRGCLVSGQYCHNLYSVEEVAGFDLTPMNKYSPHRVSAGSINQELEKCERLSEVQVLCRFDLQTQLDRADDCTIELLPTKSGRAEAILWWLLLDFGAGICLDNSPERGGCWEPQLSRILPRLVEAGQPTSIRVVSSDDYLFIE